MSDTVTVRSAKPLKFRHEMKYIMRYDEKELLCSRLAGLMQQDKNAGPKGYYKVRSLYFDDAWNTAYEDKLLGVGSRQKFRIRVYSDGDNTIHLERKIKQEKYVAKQQADLTLEEAMMLLRGDYRFLLKRSDPLCGIFYHACVTGLHRPRVMVDYEREPYVFPVGDVRITFDTDIRAGVWGYDLFDDRMPMVSALDDGWLIMEVKYTEVLPNFIRSALPTRSGVPTAVSKYVLACEKTMFAAR